MMRVFVDANILFSAAHSPAGACADFCALAPALGFELVSSDYALQEAHDNLLRKHPAALAAFNALLNGLQLTQDALPALCPLPALKDKDKPILAAAIQAQCAFLLTGDLRDFGAWMDKPAQTGGVRIVTLPRLLEAQP